MRRLVWLAMCACGGAKAPAPSNVELAPPQGSPLLVTDAPMDCTSTTENAKPGNHDRYAFEGSNGLYGYKDGRGNIVIAPTLMYGYEFKPGGIATAVDRAGKFVFIDTSGKVLAFAFSYDSGPDYFQEGFARIVDVHGKIGFISDRGVIPAGLRPQFTKADSFCNGRAHVEVDGGELVIDRTGARADR